MPIYLRRATYIEMYEQNFPPISLANMDIQDGDHTVQHHLLVFRREDQESSESLLVKQEFRIPPVCGTCGEAGHNARSM